MDDGGREVAADGRDGVSDAHDSPWRRNGRTAVAEREPGPQPAAGARRRVSAVRLRRDDSAVPASPWSRESVEAPLPTIGQIRSRWRRELGLEATKDEPSADDVPIAAPLSDVPRSTVSGDLILIGLVVALVVAGSLTVAWALIPDPPPQRAAAPALPAEADEVWTVDLGSDALVAVGGGIVVAASTDALAAFDVDGGRALWTHRYEGGGEPVGVAVYDDSVVLVEATTRTVTTLTGLGIDGSVAWTRPGPLSTVELWPDRPIEYSRQAAVTRIGVLDPATGEVVGRQAEAVGLAAPDHYVMGRREGELSVFDLREGRWLDPAIGEFGLRTLAPVGDHLVGLTESSDIVVYDQDGRALDQRTFVSDAFGDFDGRAELVGEVPGTSIGIVASGTSIGFDTSVGAVDVVWEVSGRVGTPVETWIGPVSVARVVDARTGEINHALVDVTNGETLAVTDEGATHEAPPTIAVDGYLLAPVVGDRSRAISAYDFDGTPRWSLALEPSADYRLADGTLFVIDGNRISAHR